MMVLAASAAGLIQADQVRGEPLAQASEPEAGMTMGGLAVEAQGPGADEGAVVGEAGVGGGVAVAGAVGGRRAGFVGEVVDEGGVAVVDGLAVAVFFDRGVALVAVVEIEGFGGAGLEVGDADPDEGFAEEGVVFLDGVGERGLAVGGDDADVAAVVLGRGEVEIGEADEDGGGADGIGDGAAVGGGVDGDFLAQGPLVVPPGVGGMADAVEDERKEQEGEEAFHRRLEFGPDAEGHEG